MSASPMYRLQNVAKSYNGSTVLEIAELDTLGELAHVYAFATVVFVGGSLAAAGGHNVLEPAVAGRASEAAALASHRPFVVEGVDRVRVTGARGGPPSPTYKVSATYHDGYRAAGMLTILIFEIVTLSALIANALPAAPLQNAPSMRGMTLVPSIQVPLPVMTVSGF